jgi:hypothetical protein
MQKHTENREAVQAPHTKRLKVNGSPDTAPAAQPVEPNPESELRDDEAPKVATDPGAPVFTEYPKDELEDNEPAVGALTSVLDTGYVNIALGKPRELHFAQFHPDCVTTNAKGELVPALTGWMLLNEDNRMRKGDKSIRPPRPDYRVFKSVAHVNQRFCRRMIFAPFVDNYGQHGIMLIKQENRRGEIHPFSQSLWEIVKKAVEQHAWVSISTESQTYKGVAAVEDLGEPEFLEGGADVGYLRRRFPPELWITTNDHPVLVELRGRPL